MGGSLKWSTPVGEISEIRLILTKNHWKSRISVLQTHPRLFSWFLLNSTRRLVHSGTIRGGFGTVWTGITGWITRNLGILVKNLTKIEDFGVPNPSPTGFSIFTEVHGASSPLRNRLGWVWDRLEVGYRWTYPNLGVLEPKTHQNRDSGVPNPSHKQAVDL